MTGAVADASPLIALGQLGVIDVLPLLFDTVTAPPAVAAEVQSVSLPPWLEVQARRRPLDPRVAATGLDLGEREAIGLALELGVEDVLLDEAAARSVAADLGLRITGTLGVLLRAKRAGQITAVRPLMDRLRALRFRLGDDVYQAVLHAAGEG